MMHRGIDVAELVVDLEQRLMRLRLAVEVELKAQRIVEGGHHLRTANIQQKEALRGHPKRAFLRLLGETFVSLAQL